jgi:hypothetical protein
VGKGPGILHREFLGFLRDCSHLTKKCALESVAFPFFSLTPFLHSIFNATQAKLAIYRARTFLPQGVGFNLKRPQRARGRWLSRQYLGDLGRGTRIHSHIPSFTDPEMFSVNDLG